MHDIKHILQSIHGDEIKMSKLQCMMERLIKDSDNPSKYEIDLHILEHGYHFDEHMYKKAMMGKDPKWTPETVNSLLSSHGITFTGEYEGVTIYDKAYVMNTLYKKFYPLIADSSATAKFTEKYIKCDYPIVGGKAFAEWKLRQELEMN